MIIVTKQYHIRNQRAKLHRIGCLHIYNSTIGRPSYFRFVSDFASFLLRVNLKNAGIFGPRVLIEPKMAFVLAIELDRCDTHERDVTGYFFGRIGIVWHCYHD